MMTKLTQRLIGLEKFAGSRAKHKTGIRARRMFKRLAPCELRHLGQLRKAGSLDAGQTQEYERLASIMLDPASPNGWEFVRLLWKLRPDDVDECHNCGQLLLVGDSRLAAHGYLYHTKCLAFFCGYYGPLSPADEANLLKQTGAPVLKFIKVHATGPESVRPAQTQLSKFKSAWH